MKTFEERYTAWIDNKLEGPALTSFELELSRRAAAGEARADKEDAGQLRRLLKAHLHAPAMTNAEFFSHQLRERLDAEQASNRRREESRQTRAALFTWPFARLAGLGAACLFVATALYYGAMPSRVATAPATQVAVNSNPPVVQPSAPAPADTPAPEALALTKTARSNGDQFAQASPMPRSIDLNNEIQVNVPPSADNITATPLQPKDTNASVIWINGLDYMPTVPGDSPANSTAVPAASVRP